MKRTILLLAALCLLSLPACQSSGGAVRDLPVGEVVQAVRDAYGEDYLANMEIPPEQLEAEFGLSADLYEEAYGESPMIGTHPDRVVVVKAAAGKADEVEQLLHQARERKIADELQYPVNIPKTNASQVVRKGDYVAFLLVGAPLDSLDAGEAEAARFFENEVQKAVEAFEAVLQP